MRTTRTYATAEVSAATFAEIRGILLDAGYHHAIDHTVTGREVLDMQGIGLIQAEPEEAPKDCPEPLSSVLYGKLQRLLAEVKKAKGNTIATERLKLGILEEEIEKARAAVSAYTWFKNER